MQINVIWLVVCYLYAGVTIGACSRQFFVDCRARDIKKGDRNPPPVWFGMLVVAGLWPIILPFLFLTEE